MITHSEEEYKEPAVTRNGICFF